MDDVTQVETDAITRIRGRYPPPRVPRWVTAALVGVVAAVGVSWLVWAAWIGSRPPVSAQVSAFSVPSDSAIEVTVTVDRPDPSRPVTCLVNAQAEDFTAVGEATVPVPASAYRLVDVHLVVHTLRRATSAAVNSCRPS